MNAPRLYNLRKEHLAGVRDFLSPLAIANLKNKEALGNCQALQRLGTNKHILASPSPSI
jgi:hypothetical protein